MKINKTLFLSLLFSTLISPSFWEGAGGWVIAQQPSTDEQLATQYLQNKEYDKAVVYYEKFFNKRDGITYYNPYILCLNKLQQFDKVEKVIRKTIKQYPQNPTYVVDLGTLYKNSNNKEKGNTQYEKAIKQLQPDQKQIFDLANSFLQLQEWDYAILTYQKGRKILNGFYPFNAEIADVYGRKGDITGMVDEYLNLLDENNDQMQTVQNGLQPSFGEEKDEKKNNIIKTELLKKIQSQPDKIVFSELLIWFFIQEKNFNGAFIQSKALDKRLHEEGDRMMTLGQLAVSNEEYETGAKCFQYVIEKGKENYHYVNARMEMLNAKYKKATTKFDYTPNDLLELENNFTITLNELGKIPGTAILMKNLAHLQAFFLNKTNEASDILNESIKLPGINEQTKAECKLELGDIFLTTGQIWDASLLYSQVELDFKHEPIGNEAKLRNAKLSYYNGEFKWAQAQLDVLKAATEKLIANDAMDLSLTISDNLKEDGDSLALSMFSRADLLAFRNQYENSLLILDSIAQKFPTTSLADDMLYKKYKIKMKQGKFTEASAHLQKILDNYSFDILGDDAMFKLAELNELYLNAPDKAKQLYEELLTKFPGSLYTVEARKRFRRLRGDSVN
ncbi:MAG: tetratricopeptide repeat protein [Bacteroidetes bacterium]|nr:tetratricopeptide repeat protein [Bacteroidota bacterium]